MRTKLLLLLTATTTFTLAASEYRIDLARDDGVLGIERATGTAASG